jgi:hypothetical protein
MHDWTVRYFVVAAMREDTEPAAEWVAKIKDPAIRAEAAKAIGK